MQDITFKQWASSQMNVLDPDGRWEKQTTNMFNKLGVVWEERSIFETKWDKQVSVPSDIHMYHFKTDASVSTGSTLLLEAVIIDVIWFPLK